ncbi:Helicase associated domain protein [Candidatus Njordibacter sp. Uisw_058]|uniref:Helicase associated domain protein n=1 Tax=Candidatus Njordibacter sp. Uisw_058 TaxID=3230974 RepID=UPI003FD79DAE
MHPFLELIDTFSTDNKARGDQFEKLCKWILENHPMYKSKLKQVWLWNDWPECWGIDCGIDLIAEDVDGNNWAIQAKCYSPKNSVTKTDIDSFLNESTNTRIHHRLLIATTDGIGRNAKGVIKRQHETIPVNQLMLSDLLEAPIVWPKSLDVLSTGGVKKAYIPKPYQQIAIDKVTQNLDDRGQLIMACGTGKTLTALWIAEALKSETVLVLLPSLLLLSKTLAEWLTHSKEQFSYLPVCSDDTVAKSEDTIALSTSELSFPSTTDTDAIAKFLKSSGRKIIFSTYQSSPKIAEAFKAMHLKPLDLVIADEAHRCAGKVGSAYSTVLDNDQIPAAKRLFMTATPRIFQAHFLKKASDSGVDIVSMDDHEAFGAVLHKLSFGEAIEQDLLTDYQVVIVGIDNPRYSEMITERRLVQTDNDIQSDAQSFASHIGLAKAMKSYDLKRVISFHSRVSAAKDFANKLPEVIDWMPDKSRPDGELLTGYVSGVMPTNKRSRNLRALGEIESDQRYVLSNARCLSEGVDVPALDGVAFIDPKNSEIDIVQAVGRAIRLSKGKSIGSIIIPVFIEDHDDPDEILNSSPFKKVWAVVNALRSHDGELGEQLDKFRHGIGRRGTVGRSDKIIFDKPTTITADFEKALNTRLIESTTASWEFWFGLLENYKEKFGNCLVRSIDQYNDYNLGSWVSTQRTNEKTLAPDRWSQLNDLGFVWDTLNNQWEEGYRDLVAYKIEFGDVLVPNSYITKSGSNRYKTQLGSNLGTWLATQRKNQDKLTKDQFKRLNDLGVAWDPRVYGWEQGFQHLVSYKEEFGDCLVEQKCQYCGFALGSWVRNQRTKEKTLAPERWSRLNNLGFVWDVIEYQWERGIINLTAYKEEFGDCLVGKITQYFGFNLGQWVADQRKLKNNDKLQPDKSERLNDLGFIWDSADYKWQEGFKHLTSYNKEHGNCLVDVRAQYCGYPLGSWASTLRRRYGNLKSEQISQLNELGFVWDVIEYQWQKGFRSLIAYEEEYGNCLVRKRTQYAGYNLGEWVSKQRSQKDKLLPERFKLLNDLGFVWKV